MKDSHHSAPERDDTSSGKDQGQDPLTDLLSRYEVPPPGKDLLPRMVRSGMRARKPVAALGLRRGFALGIASASVVCILLVMVLISPENLQVDQLRAQANSFFDDTLLVASNDDTVIWEDSKPVALKDLLAQNSKNRILNLTQGDIQSQDVTAILDVPVDLHDAVVRISLDSGIELRDLPGLNVVEWKSDFLQGSNVLNLSLATVEEDIDRFNSVRVRVSHPDYATEIWINIAQDEHPEF